MGVIATHDEYPIERMKLDRRQKWLASVSHDECIKLTDVENMLEDSDDEGEGAVNGDDDEVMDEGSGDEASAADDDDGEDEDEESDADEEEEDSDVDMDAKPKAKKAGGKGGMGDMGRSQPTKEDAGFFDDL